jgi:ABC-2 type transport system permease protein
LLLVGNELYGTRGASADLRDHPAICIGSFGIIPIIIAVFYAGELVWRDRERKMHEIIDATSLPNWAYLVPKALAVTLRAGIDAC